MLRRGLLISTFLLVVLSVYSMQDLGTLGISNDSLRTKRERFLRDTIKNKYDAKTTRFTYERNFKFNDLTFYTPDTLPDNLHQFTDLERNNNLIQNLGGIGTASRNLFFEPKSVVGRTSGYHAYDEAYIGPDKIRYFDTRSPYTDIKAFFGGGGRAITDVLFTLNDSIHFNIGFNIKSLRIDKHLALLGRGDRSVQSTNWNFFGFLRPKKVPRYLLLFNLTQMNHTAAEQGGITEALAMTAERSNFFDNNNEGVALTDAESFDKRGGFHVYQQFDLDSVFQIYHSGTFLDQILRYNDVYNLDLSDSLIYVNRGATTGTIADRTIFREFTNEFGVKGYTKKFAYTLFYRNRNVTYNNLFLTTRRDSESYFGGTLRQQVTPKIFLKAEGEYLFGGGYLVSGDFTSDFFNARFSRVQSRPSYLSELYLGEQRGWSNSFSNELSDNIYGELKINTKRVSFRPFVRFNRITDHIYFGPDRQPLQASGDIVLFSPGINFDYQIGEHWFWKSTAAYSTVGGGSSDVYRIPELLANAQLSYRNVLFDGNMVIHTGIDAHYRTDYTAYAYDPLVQQFYLQDEFQNGEVVKFDIFLNFKVKNFLFFVKGGHINQPFTDGYFISPFFTGTPGTLDLGARWSFYD